MTASAEILSYNSSDFFSSDPQPIPAKLHVLYNALLWLPAVPQHYPLFPHHSRHFNRIRKASDPCLWRARMSAETFFYCFLITLISLTSAKRSDITYLPVLINLYIRLYQYFFPVHILLLETITFNSPASVLSSTKCYRTLWTVATLTSDDSLICLSSRWVSIFTLISFKKNTGMGQFPRSSLPLKSERISTHISCQSYFIGSPLDVVVVLFSRLHQKNMVEFNMNKNQREKWVMNCPRCHSENIIKNGSIA